MKYMILRCEDLAAGTDQTPSLLENSKLGHLQQLAQAGAGGTIQLSSRRPTHRFDLHRGLLGLNSDEPGVSAAQCYAAGANILLGEGETAWCCELITHQEGRILDATAGRITTKESELLVHALDEELGSDSLRWEIGEGPHHLLITTDPDFERHGSGRVPAPELLVGEAWRDHLPKGVQGDALAAVIEQAAAILEPHPVNRVRVDLRENPANLVWLWGAAQVATPAPFRQQTGFSGAVSSSHFLLRGLARCLGLGWRQGPASLEDATMQRWTSSAARLIREHDLTYLHLPIETADPVERLCAMERMDHMVHTLTDTLSKQPWRLLVVLDERREQTVPFVAIGTGLPQQPVTKLHTAELAESPLRFDTAAELFSWFTRRAA